jgi:hypothetical protein
MKIELKRKVEWDPKERLFKVLFNVELPKEEFQDSIPVGIQYLTRHCKDDFHSLSFSTSSIKAIEETTQKIIETLKEIVRGNRSNKQVAKQLTETFTISL